MEQHEFNDLIAALERKAQSGDSLAMKHLGDAYYQGPSGKEKNVAAALPHWKHAADNGELSVAFKVGQAFYDGIGCNKSETTAFHYYLLSADSGDLQGQFVAGLCYESGIGCSANEANAKRYYEKAALRGHGQAQWRLGCLQFVNKERDGFHWICCAHLSGVKDATDALNNFIGNGTSLDVIQYQIDLIEKNGIDPKNSQSSSSSNSISDNGGCYVATCVYGSYDCPQVWTLRRFRDYTLAETWYGRLFVRAYYAISPILVRWFGHTSWFKRMWRRKLDQVVSTLQSHGVESSPYQDKQW